MIRRVGITDVPWFLAQFGNKVSHISSILHHRCNYGSPISQLRVLASHKTNFESVAQGTWESDMLPFGRCHFLSDPCLFACIF